ncbi:MAG TPA: hypothetical protein VG146_13130 [Verrucomicrobiae bacterium]|nr:hypothetical protein [Verrucomicrobiae bacterium]
MIDVSLSILALIAGGLTLELFTTTMRSAGLRDAQGVSLGTEAQELAEDFQAGNPS